MLCHVNMCCYVLRLYCGVFLKADLDLEVAQNHVANRWKPHQSVKEGIEFVIDFHRCFYCYFCLKRMDSVCVAIFLLNNTDYLYKFSI